MRRRVFALARRNMAVAFIFLLAGSVAAAVAGAQAPTSPSTTFVRVYSADTPTLTPPVRVREVKLTYTPEAMRARIQGTVGLSITVSADGTVRDAMVTKSLDATNGLDASAVEAASKWVYQPGKLNDQRVAVRLEISLGAVMH